VAGLMEQLVRRWSGEVAVSELVRSERSAVVMWPP